MLASGASLAPADRKTTGDILQSSLVDLLALAMTAKQAHWNLYGHGFRSLHQHLDEIAATARDLADDLAERAATLTVAPDGRATAVAAADTAPFPEGPITVAHTLTTLTARYATLIARMRRRITDTADTDPITQDLLITVTAALEKQHWMLHAEIPA